MLIQFFCITFLLLGFMIYSYYYFLAVYALSKKGKTKPIRKEKPFHTFAIVIPAHNEEDLIPFVLQSCAELDYPEDKYEVFVVADNCSDQTANVAAETGVTSLERHDPVNRGKGFALAWAFDRVLPKGHDALIVLDADCQLETQALQIFDQYMLTGDRVLQANNIASNPDVSPISYALAIGNVIENDLFYAPKSELGLAVFLRGTGMVVSREVLKAYPWKAHSIVEDVEYTINLFRNGIRPRFVREVKVESKFPVHDQQLDVQRTRWASGNLSFFRKYFLKLIWEGLFRKQWVLLDAGWTFLVLGRPLVLLVIFISLVFAALCAWLSPGTFSSGLLGAAIILFSIQGLYFALGGVFLGITGHRLRLLLGTPVAVLRLIVISVRGFLGVNKNIWARRPR